MRSGRELRLGCSVIFHRRGFYPGRSRAHRRTANYDAIHPASRAKRPKCNLLNICDSAGKAVTVGKNRPERSA